jgi:hypothetical protein
MLKIHFLHTIYSNSCLFYVTFPDVFVMVYILRLWCLSIDHISVPTVCEERRLAFLSFCGPVSHLMMAEMDSRIWSGIWR